MSDAKRRLIAVATRDPLDGATFSGLSRNLFTALTDLGFSVDTLATRDLRRLDYLTGALNLRGFARGQFRGRRAPKINPNWLWSRRSSERMSQRFDAKLASLDHDSPIVQIGTHVRTALPGRRSFCVTDATVVQAVAADEFSVARADKRVIAEAIEWQGEVFSTCDRVFVLSAWAKASVVDDYGIAADRVIVLGAGANVSVPLPRKVDTDKPYVLFVGADWVQKGGPLLLDAFHLVRRRLPDAQLVIVGCRPAVAEPGVKVVGTLDRRVASERDRLFDLYAGASAFCIAPRFDAFPNVLLEAGFYGVPVVSTDEGSRGEAIMNEVTGLLAAQRDPALLADALWRVLSDPSLAQRLGEAARQRVTTEFSWPTVAARLASYLSASPTEPEAE